MVCASVVVFLLWHGCKFILDGCLYILSTRNTAFFDNFVMNNKTSHTSRIGGHFNPAKLMYY